jgi:hypothetical protein
VPRAPTTIILNRYSRLPDGAEAFFELKAIRTEILTIFFLNTSDIVVVLIVQKGG